jgi:hypothetical protein
MLECNRKSIKNRKDTQKLIAPKNTATITKSNYLEKELCDWLIYGQALEDFPNGIRPKSIIDIGKLKNLCFKVKGKDFPFDSIDIPKILASIGIRHNDKIYVIPKGTRTELINLIMQIISEGNRLFYYDKFYNVHATYLQDLKIFSAELLHSFLCELLPSLYYFKYYFTITNNVTIESELLHCFNDTICLSYEELNDKMPYIPLDKIKQTLALNSSFIWVKKGVYTHTSKFQIDYNELSAIKAKIKNELSIHNYFPLISLDLAHNLELNPELSETAVRNGLFQIGLSGDYEKRGNVITKKGNILTSSAVIEDYCLSHDRLTIDHLIDFEREINGRICCQSLFIAYDTMIRVDKNTFVSDNTLCFDIKKTDKALSMFVNADVIPLQTVTSFTTFPHIDTYKWNLFLLESYCKRFSKIYNFSCLSVNKKNVGAIFLRSKGFSDYIEVLATAVVNADIRLTEKIVGDFLFEHRYIAQRTSAVLKVINKVKQLGIVNR